MYTYGQLSASATFQGSSVSKYYVKRLWWCLSTYHIIFRDHHTNDRHVGYENGRLRHEHCEQIWLKYQHNKWWITYWTVPVQDNSVKKANNDNSQLLQKTPSNSKSNLLQIDRPRPMGVVKKFFNVISKK